MHRRGIFSCDPGGSSGLAWAVIDIDEGIAAREHAGSKTVNGSEESQIVEICKSWEIFYRRCVEDHGLPPDKVDFVCENFVPQPGKAHTDEGVLSIRIIWGIIGYRMGRFHEYDRSHWGPSCMPEMILQMAGLASGYANDDRLRRWGLWVRGREHERSAWRHFAYRVSKLRQIYAAAG